MVDDDGNSIESRMERLEKQMEETQKIVEELLRILRGRGSPYKREDKGDR